MPRKAREQIRPWRHGPATLGFIRSGTYYIYRVVHGRRYRLSTGCRTAEAAVDEYRRWEKDPPRYVPRSSTGSGWAAAVVEFIRYSESSKGNTSRHVDAQESHLAGFGAWVRDGVPVFSGLDSFTAQDVRDFLEALQRGEITDNEVGPPSHNRYLASLKGFMRWARDVARITGNTADLEVAQLREDKGVELPVEIPKKRWTKVLAKLDERWRSACIVLLGAGLRYSELARMAPADIRPRAIHVPRAKNRKARTVPVTLATASAARILLALGGVPQDQASQIDHRIAAAAALAGEERFTAHELRHTYACSCVRNHVDLRELQLRLGHANIATTQIYLTVIRAHEGNKRASIGAPI